MALGRTWRRLARAWQALSHLGAPSDDDRLRRVVVATNQFALIAAAVSIPYIPVFLVVGGWSQWPPAAAHLGLCLAWAGTLLLNARGRHLAASVAALGAPIVEYTLLASWFTADAGFQYHLFAGGAVSFVVFGLHQRWLRATAFWLCIAAILLVESRWDGEPGLPGVSGSTITALGVANIIVTVALLYTVSGFNALYYMRERERNAVLLHAAQTAAQTDSLTDLLNRRGVAPLLNAVPHQGDYALALVDLDRFKLVNDRLGHAAGDVVLANAAQALARSVGGRGTVARWGGEEFLVLLPRTTLQQADALMEQVRADIEREYGDPESLSRVTISVGLAHAARHTAKDDALRLADANLYEAKSSGRNLVVSRRVQQAD